jgi:hypothetical protein
MTDQQRSPDKVRRRWNLPIWLGFLLVQVAGFGYLPLSGALPGTADWLALIGMVAGMALIAAGLVRALRQPALHRGRIAAPILLLLALAMTAFFSYGTFYHGRQVPLSPDAPRPGSAAPPFTLADTEGRMVSLPDLLDGRGVVLIFYRGHW